MQIISIVNLKGGVGKTCSAINIATNLQGKTLLIDVDPQANSSIQMNVSSNRTLYDFFIDKVPLEDLIIPGDIDVIPSNLGLSKLESMTAGTFLREFILQKGLKKLKGYDNVVIDCPPTFDVLTKNACLCATKIIVPSSPEPHSVSGLYYLDQVLSEIECSIHNIFVTMYDKRTKIHRNILDEMKQMYPGKLTNTIIRRATVVNESCLEQSNLKDYVPEARVTKDYQDLIEELKLV